MLKPVGERLFKYNRRERKHNNAYSERGANLNTKKSLMYTKLL